ncbi:Zinc-ribbon containing domain-containing protein [Virgibacillus subterraneus]|uniref:Zinc-ribbon containing domain-containing protein n=2 Tax=Virgibacillus TaxID=84406 RepID=A0A1H1G6U9_9BACI|nr:MULTISPECIES: YgzB family protein [Virgibacillus]SDR08910.1 Zinc-ribbon containing domain-containing protein [Virgibacillus salinus]SER05629.1 Zinc-ribbon containing domain-containing protein [Virgibacillus subterraneus]
MAQQLVYSSKINKIRSFALIQIFIGFAFMYGGILTKKIEWLMVTFFIIGVLFVIFSCVVYFWIGLLSTKAVPIICPNCENPTKMLGRVDACMHCKEPLTLDKDLEGKEFDEKYNTRKYRKEAKANTKNNE